jgi:hypothetical protein
MQNLLTISLLLLVSWPSSKDQPPKHGMIEEAYFCCDKCHTLEGGIWGKGPKKFFAGPGKKSCVHQWRRITRDEFKALAVKLYGFNWKSETWFWTHEEDTLEQLTNVQGNWVQVVTGDKVPRAKLRIDGIDYRWEIDGKRAESGRLSVSPGQGSRKEFSAYGADRSMSGSFEVAGERLTIYLKPDREADWFRDGPASTTSVYVFERAHGSQP